MGQRLDRSRPLWEVWLVEGLARHRWALISKVHHCMVDGVAGTEIYYLLLSPTEEIETPTAPPPWQPPPLPSSLSLALDALGTLALNPVRQVQAAVRAATTPRATWGRLTAGARGLVALSGALRPVPDTTLLGTIGAQRRYAATSVGLRDVKEIAHAHGVTVNDVALAAATAGFRALLLSRGERCTPNTVRSLVPVSVRAPSAHGVFDNRVSCLLADLPVHVPEPVQRLRAVHAHLARLKSLHEAEAGVAVTEVAAHEPFPLVAPLVRAAWHLPQHSLATVTTNVPGPREPLYLQGRRLLQLLPYVPIASRIRSGIAILSYCDTLSFGVTADYASGADIELMTSTIAGEIAYLRRQDTRPRVTASADAS
jgi:diacylglycerol O-acyltransferase